VGWKPALFPPMDGAISDLKCGINPQRGHGKRSVAMGARWTTPDGIEQRTLPASRRASF
jgi:hypothetical protein